MDFLLNNNNNTLANNDTKLLRWLIFLNIHYTGHRGRATGLYISMRFAWWYLDVPHTTK